MPYKRIHELESELALSLSHDLAVDKSGSESATKALLSEISDLIKAEIISELEASGGLDKAGDIKMHGGSSAPDGWIFCDNASLLRAGTYADLFAEIGTTFGSVDGTHFNVPDFRGIAPMGAGTSAKLVDANGVPFARVLGTYQNDKFQGHRMYKTVAQQNVRDIVLGGTTANVIAAAVYNYSDGTTTGDPVTDTSNGTPRTGVETNPANLGINFIIKY